MAKPQPPPLRLKLFVLLHNTEHNCPIRTNKSGRHLNISSVQEWRHVHHLVNEACAVRKAKFHVYEVLYRIYKMQCFYFV